MTVFIKRYPSKGELPNKGGNYNSDKGLVFFNNVRNEFEHYYLKDEANIQYWLEEIELPSEESIPYYAEDYDLYPEEVQGFIKGANFILNHLKSNTNG